MDVKLYAVCLALSLGVSTWCRLPPEVTGDGGARFPSAHAVGDTSALQGMTTPEIIASFGYKVETHHVVTEDGYILELHRIPYGIEGPSEGARSIAFLQHCLMCSSSYWLFDKPGRALAYLLADAGYDVWMNNDRGNTYSRNHTTLDPDNDKEKFWEFTWGEMGYYDIPAAIDYALELTGNSAVYYVGFSMGTTTFFALMSDRPEYAHKIKVAALLAPVAYYSHIRGGMRLVAHYSSSIETILTLIGQYEILASPASKDYMTQYFCAKGSPFSSLCSNFIFQFYGFDLAELNQEYLSVALSHAFAGTSFYTVNHYMQLVYKDVYQKYDWGMEGNEKHYGQKEPPLYNLDVDTPPLGLFWSANDFLANPEDVARLSSELRNVVLNHKVEYDQWSHLDFVLGIHAKEFLYDYVLDFLTQY